MEDFNHNVWQVSYLPEDDEIIVWMPCGLVTQTRDGYRFEINSNSQQVWLGPL